MSMTSRYGLTTSTLLSARFLKNSIAASRPVYTSLRWNGTSSIIDEDVKPSETQGRREEFSPLGEKIRALMRRQPNGLATVVAPSEIPEAPAWKRWTSWKPPERSALLVSSFNTVTLHPTPYVSFNIKTPSRTLDNIKRHRFFTVSGIDDAKTAHYFAGATKEANRKADQVANLKAEETYWKQCIGPSGEVKPYRGGRWWIMCMVNAEYTQRVEDHVIVVGKVVKVGGLETGPEYLAETSDGGKDGGYLQPGTVYIDGKYRDVGRILSPTESSPREIAMMRHVAIKKHPRQEDAVPLVRKVGQRLVRNYDFALRRPFWRIGKDKE